MDSLFNVKCIMYPKDISIFSYRLYNLFETRNQDPVTENSF